MNVLDGNALLTLAAVPVQSFQQHGVGPGQLVRLGQIFALALEGLLPEHRAPETLHRGVMRLVMAECWTIAVRDGIDPATIYLVFTETALGQPTNLKVRTQRRCSSF